MPHVWMSPVVSEGPGARGGAEMLGCSEERGIQELGVLQGLLPAGQRSRGAHGALCLLPQLPQPYAGQGITEQAEL